MAKEKLVLTKHDRQILDSCRIIAEGLGEYLGDGYEIILHSLDNLNSSVISIINGYHSGRQTGAPVTDLALEMLKNIEKSKDHKPISYFTKRKNDVVLKSSTIPIMGEGGRIIGLLCINFYTDIPLDRLIANFIPNAYTDMDQPIVEENFPQSIDDLIADSVNSVRAEVMDDDTISTANKNREIIFRLREKGIFNIKDAVVKVAQQMNISKNTVYMHLRKQ